MNLYKDFPEFLVTFIIMYFLNQEILKKKKKKNPHLGLSCIMCILGLCKCANMGLAN